MALTRRQFAQLLGASALGTGIAPALRRRAGAQEVAAPVRFLAIRTPHGTDRDYWIPRNTNGSEPDADAPLSGLMFAYENSMLDPLAPWADRITIIDGLDTQVTKEGTRGGVRTAHGHNEQGTLLTGAQPPANREGVYDGHPSLDFFLHGRLGAPALLTASVEGAGTWKCMSYDDAGRPRNPETNPASVFRAAFPADFAPPDPEEPVVDFTAGEQAIAAHGAGRLEALRARLGRQERAKIDAHLAAMNALTPGSGAPLPGGACTTRGTDVPARDGRIRDWSEVRDVARAHARVIGQAFACGRSRCATLQILNDFPNYYTDVPGVRTAGIRARYGDTFRFHENLVHDYWLSSGSERTTLREGYATGQRWAAGHFAAVLEELSALADPFDPAGGSILDNTVIFWHNEFGHDGHDRQETRHPTVIAGGGGRVLRLGRYLRLRNIDSNERVPHNRLLVSLCHAVGETDVDFFGDRDLVDRPEYRGPLAPLMA
ncbi:MAG: DUF1552 domain-containing protein [Myxococcota bacterium]